MSKPAPIAGNPTTVPAAGAPRPAATRKEPPKLLVLDTTATAADPLRKHEMVVDGAIKVIEFKAGEPRELDAAVALKFLKHDAFKLVDKNGHIKPFMRPPRQPDELQAGETIQLADNETIARYDELSTQSLQHRCLQMQGSEQFAAESPSRPAMIAFIVADKEKKRKENTRAERAAISTTDVIGEEFTPEAEPDEAAA